MAQPSLGLARGAARTSAVRTMLGNWAAPVLQDQLPTFDALRTARRGYRHRGVLKLLCSECRYVIRRWHVPILAVDCNANPRHKQAMTNTAIRSRWATQFPAFLLPWVEGKQYPRKPHYRREFTFETYNRKRHRRLR
eukprot:NODE_23843_length_649_cov_3.540230.p1 GENE.NODE_23843_length_649_cov_3.540230~~NODE_23843_length_649_cov_3.540230.p1  ORF type:complete len:158 (-),score=33.39 NODE_23843_length_649_cov_3.540230:176-586(-)